MQNPEHKTSRNEPINEENNDHERSSTIHKKNFVNSSDAITHNKPGRSIDFLKEKETKILRGEHAVFQMLDEIVLNCKNYFFEYGEKSALIVIYKIPEYSEFYKRLRTNGVKIKFLTDMTTENIRECKQFVKDFGAEMKHLEGLRGSFAVTEQIYISINELESKRPEVELITSNVLHVVKQNQFIFDILWNKATPAKQRIREIEEGMLPVETRIVENPGEIFDLVLDITKKSNNGLSNCSTIGGFKMIYENKKLFQSYSNLLSRYKERNVKGGRGGRGGGGGDGGDGGGIRWITHIEDKKEQVDLINKFLNIGIEIRHANNLPPISFALSDKQFQGTIEKMEHGKMFKNVLYSTEPLYIKHFQSIFEELWKTGIDAQERINQIEKGLGSVITKVIENPNQTKVQLERMLEDAKEEILVIFSTLNALQRYENAGLVNMLIDKSHVGIKIKILSPIDKYTHRTILEKNESSDDKTKNIMIRGIANQQAIRSTIVMIDKKSVLTIELKDDNKDLLEDAIGLSTFSTSAPTVLSYVSIFDSLWTLTEMYENLRIANHKLIESEQIEREFINTAAHELRTPTQAITGYSEFDDEVFDYFIKNKKHLERPQLEKIFDSLHRHHEGISRNATRLNNLINNLLDVARIDSSQKNMLMLNKEDFDLVREIQDLINFELNQKLKYKNIRVNFINQTLNESCLVYADRSRVIQVVTNLLDNAIKFSKNDSTIDIMIQDNKEENNYEKREKKRSVDPNRQDKGIVYVAISDSGKGISPDMLPRLFEKFMTNSNTGTGLGLYISKKLVEAMGGKIIAFNNNDGIGSTFVFSLPLTEKHNPTEKDTS